MTDTPPSTRPTSTDRRTRLARLALVVYWPLLATATHWPSLSLTGKPAPPTTEALSLVQGDKVMHLITFGLLALLLNLARPIGRKRGLTANRFAAAGIVIIYAVVDELTQTLAFERTASISDMLANTIGAVGVLLVSMSPRDPVARPTAKALRSTRRRYLGAVAGIFLGGLLLSASGTVNRETYAVHFVAAAAFTFALLRAAPLWPARPRVGVVLACVVVGGTVAVAEMAQAFAGLPFSHREAFFGQVGLLSAMALWSVRLAVAGPAPAEFDRADAGLADDEDTAESADAVPANPPSA